MDRYYTAFYIWLALVSYAVIQPSMTSDNIVVTVAIPDWLDADFIAATLRRDVGDANLTLDSCVFDGTTKVGENYMSAIVRASIEYHLPGGKEATKLKLIIKSLPPSELIQKWIFKVGAFDHELEMYSEILPKIHALYKEAADAAWTPLAPHMFATDLPNTLLLEDLTPHGFRIADRRQGLDLEHSVLALATLARMHAASLVLYDKQPDAMDNFKEVFYVEENRNLLSVYMASTFDSLAREVATWEGYERFAETLKKIWSTSVDRSIDLFKYRPGSLRVLNHGDFWINNMLYRYDEEGNPVDFRMIDFQAGRFASPAFDLYFFLYTSPREDVLESSFDFLVSEYHKALTAALRQLGSETSVAIEQIQEELADKEYFAVFIACSSSIIFADPSEAPEFSKLTNDDLETLSATLMSKANAGKRFRSRFQRRLVNFEKLGLI